MISRFLLTLCLAAAIAVPAVKAQAGEGLSYEVLQTQVKKARDKVMPALVRVQPIIETYRGGRKVSRTGFGSGVITGPQGYVITNFHVAGKAKSCICVMANKEEIPARLLGGDPWTDIAVIQLDLTKYTGNTLTWAILGDSDRMQEGDFVLAMGSPFALTRTVTFGIISCRDRSLGVMGIDGHQRTGQFNTWLQIDALINPGNSGGPLVNLKGEVVGINARGGRGMGFAIPINIVREVSRQIIAHGEVRRSFIGVRFQPMEKFKKKFLGGLGADGVLISNVDEDSPASRAGILAGDVVISMNGRAVSARFEEEIYPIAKLVADLPVGTRLTLEYVRKKQKMTATFATEKLERVTGDEEEFSEWGFTARQITRSLAREMRLKNAKGILITGSVSGSVAYKAGLRSGDILSEIDGQAVKNLAHFQKMYKKLLLSKKKKLLGRVLGRRGGVLTSALYLGEAHD
jgi:serine protease Do